MLREASDAFSSVVIATAAAPSQHGQVSALFSTTSATVEDGRMEIAVEMKVHYYGLMKGLTDLTPALHESDETVGFPFAVYKDLCMLSMFLVHFASIKEPQTWLCSMRTMLRVEMVNPVR